jgi:hypothetical protein
MREGRDEVESELPHAVLIVCCWVGGAVAALKGQEATPLKLGALRDVPISNNGFCHLREHLFERLRAIHIHTCMGPIMRRTTQLTAAARLSGKLKPQRADQHGPSKLIRRALEPQRRNKTESLRSLKSRGFTCLAMSRLLRSAVRFVIDQSPRIWPPDVQASVPGIRVTNALRKPT